VKWHEVNEPIPTFEQWQAFSTYDKYHLPLALLDLNDKMRCHSMPMNHRDPWSDEKYVKLWNKFRLRCYNTGWLHPDGELCAHVLSEDESTFRQAVADKSICAVASMSGAAYRSQDPVLMQTIFSTALDAACNVSSFRVSKVAYNAALDVVREFNAIQTE
jgi:hypothetical protein